jgi:pyruvate,orthophosphate dikinase
VNESAAEPPEAVPDVIRLDGTQRWDRSVLGGKAAGIAVMRGLGVPVPPAFTITTGVCGRFLADGEVVLDELWPQVKDAMTWLEEQTSRGFGVADGPLLVSVRSGAPISMPGMMDTVLNLGIDSTTLPGLVASGGNGYATDTNARFREVYSKVVGMDAPTEVWEQLRHAVAAVFKSWQSPRAIAYRKNRGLSEDGGTAVTVQAMIFGNLDDASGSGVIFSRNPLTGGDEPYGEWLARGQGEDVVSGSHTPVPLARLADDQPEIYRQLLDHASTLERLGRDVQDIEFTVESGKLWLLQTRSAKRSPHAAVRLAVALERDGLIDSRQALRLVSAEQVRQVQRPGLIAETIAGVDAVAEGLSACPGSASGIAVTDANEAEALAETGERVVLIRETTNPEDLHGMLASVAIATELGGATSHAAVVSREIGLPCVVGCGEGTLMHLAGERITVAGDIGKVFAGELDFVAWSEQNNSDLRALYGWAREHSTLTAHIKGRVPDGTDPVDASGWGDAEVASALSAGTSEVMAEHPLPILLAALNSQQDS